MHSLLRDFDLFIFDWDGTLSTSTILVRLSHFFKLRYNTSYIKEHADEFRQPKRASIPFKATQAQTADFIYELYGLFARPKLREGSIELLEKLRKHNKRIALFTDGAQHRVAGELKRLKLEKYFDIIVSAETIHAYKPNPTGLNFTVKRMRARKEKSLYIGDMAIDIFTARFANMKVCTVGNGLDPYAKLLATKPDYIFESTEALARKID